MRQSLSQTFAVPIILLLLTVVGLSVGLVADGLWDWLSVAALAIPLLVIGRRLFVR